MATTAQKREWWADWRCDTDKQVRLPFPGAGRTWNLPVADASAPAWETFIDLMNKHNYLFRESAGGTYNCRKIGGTNSWSLHAYGIALDLNPSVNSYGQSTHDFPAAFLHDVNDTGLFRWGGTWRTPDPMHFEIDVPPDEISQEEEMPLDQIGKAVVDIAFDLLGATGDRNYWYDKEPDDPEFQDLRAAIGSEAQELKSATGGVSEARVKQIIDDTPLVRKGQPVVIKGA